MLFNIQKFSTHDGGGIRTLIFFKGCPLRCPWCSNPEGQSFDYDLFFNKRKCIGCLECVKASKEGEFQTSGKGIVINRERIKNPLVFKDICPAKAIQVIGEKIDLKRLMGDIEKDKLFFNKSGGGVTFSGGEPFAQPNELLALAKAIKTRGISTAVETCMDVPWKDVEDTIGVIDEFLVDLKHVDAKRLKEATGSDFGQVEDNLKKLENRKISLTIRVPVIPGFNDNPTDMREIIDFVSSLTNVRELQFIPYHSYGKNKYSQMGLDYTYPSGTVDKKYLDGFANYAKTKGLKTNIGG